ncbi:DUF6294 family protein [Streptomyces orinoci]|uniref:DUF6294 family protein n=1 Tax=Streptomyces orinoci TaxID=67339 RepID=A0ABV3JYB1_STRON|nr:DUF6294 family protein [Streptomyces orinoci]
MRAQRVLRRITRTVVAVTALAMAALPTGAQAASGTYTYVTPSGQSIQGQDPPSDTCIPLTGGAVHFSNDTTDTAFLYGSASCSGQWGELVGTGATWDAPTGAQALGVRFGSAPGAAAPPQQGAQPPTQGTQPPPSQGTQPPVGNQPPQASKNPVASNAMHSGAAREIRPGATTATAYKWWTWPDLKVGDCHQTGGYLRLYADGKLTFSARTWTDHTFSGDIWHARFQLKNSGGQTLFTTGTFDSPTMWASKQVDWTANGTFEPSVYAATATVTQWASC